MNTLAQLMSTNTTWDQQFSQSHITGIAIAGYRPGSFFTPDQDLASLQTAFVMTNELTMKMKTLQLIFSSAEGIFF